MFGWRYSFILFPQEVFMSRILHTLRLGLMACLLVGLLPLPALAGTTDGWYASIKGGITSGPDADDLNIN